MHETVFLNEIFSVLKQKLGKGNVFKKATINVRLSPFSHVAAESLQESFRQMREKDFGKVSLNIRALELPLECKSCKRRTAINERIFNCPFCNSADISIQMDREFFVEDIEI